MPVLVHDDRASQADENFVDSLSRQPVDNAGSVAAPAASAPLPAAIPDDVPAWPPRTDAGTWSSDVPALLDEVDAGTLEPDEHSAHDELITAKTGWRTETYARRNKSGTEFRYWQWRKGSHGNRKAGYGGAFSTLSAEKQAHHRAVIEERRARNPANGNSKRTGGRRAHRGEQDQG